MIPTTTTASDSVSEAYEEVLRYVSGSGIPSAPRGKPIVELMTYVTIIDHPQFETPVTRDENRNAVMGQYMRRELELYQEGTLSAERWRDDASKFWWDIRNPDDTINSNYGTLTMMDRDAPGDFAGDCGRDITQWEWARESILADEDTRQAVMHFNRPRHQWHGNRDFPCTMYGIFHVRLGELHYSTHMRSQDIVLGWPYDVPFFVWQLTQMAEETGHEVGSLRHVVDSLHMYERDRGTAQKMLGES